MLLAACGGGGSSGPAMATVTSSNAKDLAIASTNAANQSKTSSALNIFGKTSAPNTQLIVYETIAKGIAQAHQAPQDSMLCSSGTGIIDQTNGTLIFTDTVSI